jgi:hypothetical protein
VNEGARDAFVVGHHWADLMPDEAVPAEHIALNVAVDGSDES